MDPSATATSAKFGIAIYPCLTLLIYRELRRNYIDEDLTDATLASYMSVPSGITALTRVCHSSAITCERTCECGLVPLQSMRGAFLTECNAMLRDSAKVIHSTPRPRSA